MAPVFRDLFWENSFSIDVGDGTVTMYVPGIREVTYKAVVGSGLRQQHGSAPGALPADCDNRVCKVCSTPADDMYIPTGHVPEGGGKEGRLKGKYGRSRASCEPSAQETLLRSVLSLRELEARSCSFLPVFLPLFDSRISRNEALFL